MSSPSSSISSFSNSNNNNNNNNNDDDDQKGMPDWRKYEIEKKKKAEQEKINLKNPENWPKFETALELFHHKNKGLAFMRPPFKNKLVYEGKYKTELKKLISQYDMKFKVDLIDEGAGMKKLEAARDDLLKFLFTLYKSEPGEWMHLVFTGFMQVMYEVLYSGHCNNELSKQLRACIE